MICRLKTAITQITLTRDAGKPDMLPPDSLTLLTDRYNFPVSIQIFGI
jgi:hypothetical protein